MKGKLFLVILILVCLTACGIPAGPEPVPAEATSEATALAATLVPTALSSRTATRRPRAPTARQVVEPPVWAAYESPSVYPPVEPDDTPLYETASHPIWGDVGMTILERDYAEKVRNRELDFLGDLMDDPRYPDICGGFYVHRGTFYIFSLDDRAVDRLARKSLTEAGIRYRLLEAEVSLRELTSLYNKLERSPNTYGIESVRYRSRFNNVSVWRDLSQRADPDLAKLMRDNKCVTVDNPYADVVDNGGDGRSNTIPWSEEAPNATLVEYARHPAYGLIGMTQRERDRLEAYKGYGDGGAIESIRALGREYADFSHITGGMYYSRGTLYIFAKSNALVEELVYEELTVKNIDYALVKTDASVLDLRALCDQISENARWLGVYSVEVLPNLNCVLVEPNDPADVDPDLLDMMSENPYIVLKPKDGDSFNMGWGGAVMYPDNY